MDARSREAVEVAERFADGLATEAERAAAEGRARQGIEDADEARRASNYDVPEMFTLAARAAAFAVGDHPDFAEAALAVVSAVSLVTRDPASGLGPRDELRTWCADALRELVGNPLRAVAVDPDWRTPTVTALARQMYGSLDFSPMPILADALQDAGCEHDATLAHCRGLGPHVRGCWVVDLLLGGE